jgi:hypothetical protein
MQPLPHSQFVELQKEIPVKEGVELIKVKYIHSWDTLRNPFEH